MKVAEVEINARLTVKMNDREHKAFKLTCVKLDREMSEVTRELIRNFVEANKRIR